MTRPALDLDPVAIGRKIRTLREERGISLSELARRAEVGKATLSGLESGTRNPTLETLWAITAQLGVPFAAILDSPSPQTTVHGEAVEATLLQVFEDESATYELYRLHIPPGSQQISPGHPEGTTEHITVFTGILSAGPVGAHTQAGPGDYLTWVSDVQHSYTVIGPDDVHASLLIRYPT